MSNSFHQFNPDGRMRGSFVYLVLCGEAEKIYVKVGRSSNPFQRLTELRVGCPLVPEIMATVEVANVNRAKRLESHLHAAFKAWRSHGEWFLLSRVDKADFNAVLFGVLRNHSDPSRQLRVRRYSVPKLIRDGQRRRAYMQSRFARAGLAFRDFKNAT